MRQTVDGHPGYSRAIGPRAKHGLLRHGPARHEGGSRLAQKVGDLLLELGDDATLAIAVRLAFDLDLGACGQQRGRMLRTVERQPDLACGAGSLASLLQLVGRHRVCRVRRSRSPSRTVGSSIVDGTGSSRPSAMDRIVLRRILPDRVFGSASTT